MHTISSIDVEIINDSRNIPTLSVTVTTGTGFQGTCMVPSGASTGKYEAYELRDDGTSHGNVTCAKDIILSVISPALIGMDVSNQKEIDRLLIELDGTNNKHRLGGNSILGVSMACAKASAKAEGKELYEYMRTLTSTSHNSASPLLYCNLINGGKHAKTKLAFQEYLVVPQVNSVQESLDIVKKVKEALGQIVKEKYGDVEQGDEGGYAVPTEDIREPLVLLMQAVRQCEVEDTVKLALDVAATSFYNKDTEMYTIGNVEYTQEALQNLYIEIAKSFPLLSIEDPFYEEDFASFAKLQNDLPEVIIVGDDLTVTSIDRVTQAVELKSISGLIIKPNQVGTLTETIETIMYGQDHGIKCIVSHRSGETMDTMIADITTAFYCFGLKSGAPGPEERDIKYARLCAIQ